MDRGENMRAIRSRDTLPERKVRSLVHALGYRFRLHRQDLPGKPDLVFPCKRKVIFVNGCFWHSHACKSGLIPKTNREFWLSKLRQNRARDKKNLRALAEKGWDVLVVWQCELKDADLLSNRLKKFLGRRGPARRGSS